MMDAVEVARLIEESDAQNALRSVWRAASMPARLSLSVGAALHSSIRGIEHTSREFRFKARMVANSVSCKLHDLALVMSFETAGSFSPSKENPISGAVGLLQFMPDTLHALGVSKSQASAMTDVQQLDLVRRYLEPFAGRIGNLNSLYMSVLWPRLVGASGNAALFSKGSKEYNQNAGLDVNHDGTVQVTEAVSRVRSMQSGTPRLLVVGDSMAEGLDVPLHRIASDEAAVFAIWKRGTTIHEWASNAAQAADAHAPSLIVVALGTNDRTVNESDVSRVIDGLSSWGGVVTWAGPFAERENLSGYVWRNGGNFLDGVEMLRREKYEMAADGIHLTPTGYAKWASDIWSALGGNAATQQTGPTQAPMNEPMISSGTRRNRWAVGLFGALPIVALAMKSRSAR